MKNVDAAKVAAALNIYNMQQIYACGSNIAPALDADMLTYAAARRNSFPKLHASKHLYMRSMPSN